MGDNSAGLGQFIQLLQSLLGGGQGQNPAGAPMPNPLAGLFQGQGQGQGVGAAGGMGDFSQLLMQLLGNTGGGQMPGGQAPSPLEVSSQQTGGQIQTPQALAAPALAGGLVPNVTPGGTAPVSPIAPLPNTAGWQNKIIGQPGIYAGGS